MRSSRDTRSANASLCTPSPGKTRKCRAVAIRSSTVRTSCHMKSASCTRKILCGSSMSRSSSEDSVARRWYESIPMPRLGASAGHTMSHAVVNSLIVRPQERPSYATLIPSGRASIASLRRSRASNSGSSVAWVDVDEHTRRTFEPRAWHISSIDFATSILYSWRCPDKPSKSRSTWNPVTFRPLARTACTALAMPSAWPTTSRAESMICEKPASRTAASFAGSVPAKEIVSMPKSRMLGSGGSIEPTALRSPAFIVHQLEHDTAQKALRKCAARLWMDIVRFDEGHAALTQCGDGFQHIPGAEADALQHLVRLRIEYPGLGVDQLEVEGTAWAFQDAPLGQDAVSLFVRGNLEAKERRVKRNPVRHAIASDVLHDAEPMQVIKRRRTRIDTRVQREIDIVDRELSMPVHKVDPACANAMDRRNIELHNFHLRGDDPGTAVDRISVRGRCIAHAQRDRGDHRRFGRLHRACLTTRVSVDNDVHVALSIEQYLARTVSCDRAKAHHLQDLAQSLRLAGGILDELDPLHLERVVLLDG